MVKQEAADGIKAANQLTLNKTIFEHLGGLNVVTRVLKCRNRRQVRQRHEDRSVWTWLTVARSEDEAAVSK